MSGTWWLGQSELDRDQLPIISLPVDNSFLVIGPPGSGKTNLLLLRANYLHLRGLRNIVIAVFTRSLREFIAAGANNYDFPASKIATCREWQYDFIRQYGGSIPATQSFEEDRQAFLVEMERIANSLNLSGVYDAILLDEAQDYTPGEIRLFRRLAERLICVADERQKIYEGEDSLAAISACVDSTHTLRFHYRNGLNICRVADEIAKRWHGYRPLSETCNYDEIANPSSVEVHREPTIEAQAARVVARLRAQLTAFPEELIGILCPKTAGMNAVWQAIQDSPHAGNSCLLQGRVSDSFSSSPSIIVSTCHAAKGLEFRALHIVGCDLLRKFGNNRRLAFTSVTRVKTSLSIYHTEDLHAYLDAALNSFVPVANEPSLDDVFGGASS